MKVHTNKFIQRIAEYKSISDLHEKAAAVINATELNEAGVDHSEPENLAQHYFELGVALAGTSDLSHDLLRIEILEGCGGMSYFYFAGTYKEVKDLINEMEDYAGDEDDS